MRNIIVTCLFLLAVMGLQTALACELCEKKQPKILRGITHGTGPQGNLDYFIIWTAAVIVLVTLVFFVKYLIWPREHDPKHIKRSFINEI